MRGITSVLLEILRARLWVVPGVAAVLATAAALVVLFVDPAAPAGDRLFYVDADSARAVLSAIAGAMITFTALVFSITMLVLQQAAAQLSPRVMRTFLRDRFSQAVLGLFVAAFVFALLVLLDIERDAASRLGVLVAVGLVLAAVLVFVAYIDHMAHAIRPTSVIRSIGAETRDAIERNYPAHATGDSTLESAQDTEPSRETLDTQDHATFAWSGESGYIQLVDEEQLLEIARDAGRDLGLLQGVGSYLVRGSPVLVLSDGPGESNAADEDVRGVVHVGSERTMSQDPEFGFRQLTDVALRALSPSLNDPTTAVQVIDELHALLRHLRDRPIPAPRTISRDGGPVVRVPAPGWDDFVRSAVDDIAQAGRQHPSIAHRLALMLRDLERDCSADRRPALRRALERIDEGASS